MKKLLAILLVLAFVGAAYAQDVKFSGYADTGLLFTKVGSADGMVTLFGDDSGQTTRINLVASYTNENMGLVLRYRVQGDVSGNLNPYLNRGYVWATMFDGMAKVLAGKLADYSWSSFGNDFGNLDTKSGVQVQIMPMAGLNFGFYIPATGTGALVEDTMKDMTFGGEYALEGIGAFRAGVNLGLDLAVADEITLTTVDVNTTDAWFSADITAVENFEFIVDYLGNNLGFSDIAATDIATPADTTFYYGSHYLFEEVDYTMDALNVGIDLEQQFFTYDEAPIALSFSPYVEYTLDTIALGGDVAYYMTTEDAAGDTYSGMYFHPYAKYTVGPKAIIELGAKINTGDITSVDPEVIATDDTTKVYLDFTWSF